MNTQQKFVVAVSGGIDSVVLLDALMHNRLNQLAPGNSVAVPRDQIIVAHVDHGIRSDSAQDEQWVSDLAKRYDVPYYATRLELGTLASEDTARKARYSFLRQCCKINNALLITAHHQDDLVETMIINLLRGTNWRGLAPMSQAADSQAPLRPLLAVPKSAIIKYANKYQLNWREDSTNQNQNYLRNYVRLTLIPRLLIKDPKAADSLIAIQQSTAQLKFNIATQLQKYLAQIVTFDSSKTSAEILRYQLVMLPSQVALEVIYTLLTQLDPQWHPTTLHCKRVLHFAKTAFIGKQLQVSGSLNVYSKSRHLQFKKG